ncbi:MAG: hypothetical protein CMQ51_05625 [Gammaproteobacteria bacterium]|nr:hypothetical protein [Gammaproteobacteria bacterium]|tara:strand:+ start:6353 stop:7165 length:813 start_codon:yes stop_codon:yes gene_type:complete
MKHNKKRNTSFLYEILVRELTYSIVSKEQSRQNTVLEIIKKYFGPECVLGKELSLCRTLHETTDVSKDDAEKILAEIKRVYFGLAQPDIFTQQTELINTINRDLGKRTFSNFVPNFKSLATISQIFDDKVPIKSKVLLESKIIEKMSSEEEVDPVLKPIDNLVFKKFTEKFNDKYSDSLLENQKELLNRYIVSFSDNGISLKMFLNDEIPTLTESVTKSMNMQEIKEDTIMSKKASQVISLLEAFKEKDIDREMISQILKIQELVSELEA